MVGMKKECPRFISLLFSFFLFYQVSMALLQVPSVWGQEDDGIESELMEEEVPIPSKIQAQAKQINSPSPTQMLEQFFKNQGKSGDREKEFTELLGQGPLGSFLRSYPKLIKLVSKMLSDTELVQGLMKGLAEKKKLENYRYVALGLLVFALLLGLVGGKNASFFKRLYKKMFVFLFLTLAQLGNFIFFFPAPAKSIGRIFKEVFFP